MAGGPRGQGSMLCIAAAAVPSAEDEGPVLVPEPRLQQLVQPGSEA